ncbi:hypothetical protein C8J57DRAFT_1678844 [Mycena rebaudengoi]|nr:hypothetical protein C8J57DRAFT_1678844 [Mycena rebaudengoi]
MSGPPPLRQNLRSGGPPAPYSPLPEGRRHPNRGQSSAPTLMPPPNFDQLASSGTNINPVWPGPHTQLEMSAESFIPQMSPANLETSEWFTSLLQFPLSRESSFSGFPLNTAAFDSFGPAPGLTVDPLSPASVDLMNEFSADITTSGLPGQDLNLFYSSPAQFSPSSFRDMGPSPVYAASELELAPPLTYPGVPSQPLLPTVGLTLPGRSSLSQMRLRQARQAQTPPLSVPSIVSTAAVYIGFPQHPIPNRRNFFLPNLVIDSPALHHIISALRNLSSPVGTVLHEICTGLAEVPYYVAWSKNLVEVHDPLFSSISTGYQEICLLVENLQQSAVILDRAQHTAASRQIFAVREVAETVPLYVIYIFSIASTQINASPSGVAPGHTVMVNSGMRSNNLKHMASCCLFLDAQYLSEGHTLSLIASNGYGTVYLQIRQCLIIAEVARHARSHRPQILADDVAAWGGIKPGTYGNKLTFATNTRATLQYLVAHSTRPEAQFQSSDMRAKDLSLMHLLYRCFAPELLGEDWREDLDLDVGAATVTDTKEKMERFKNLIASYKSQMFTYVTRV